MVRTVGIDLSLTATGVAYSDGQCFEEGKPGVTSLSVADQIIHLDNLARWAIKLAIDFRPDGVCIEGLDMSRPYGGLIERVVAWWKVVEALSWVPSLRIWVAQSPQVKMYATGKGSGDKKAVLRAIQAHWPLFDVRNSDNRADAASCALIAAHKLGEPIPASFSDAGGTLPGTHLRALAPVREISEPPPPRKFKRA